MNKYEILYILDNSLTDDAKAKMIEKFVQVVEQMNGKIVDLDKWGTKKLAYEINKKTEGYYFLMNIEADAVVPLEIERQVSITEGVYRCMIIKKDEFAVKKVKRAPKPVSKEELNYGSPVRDGIDAEFGKVTDNDQVTAENPMSDKPEVE
jgi:small subunit ribosomal protein S6